MTLRLYNTLSKRLEPFIPADPGHVTFYTCGPTVYDDAHIGNFRSFLAADLLRRFIESPLCMLATRSGAPHAGPRRVTHVMNITDVGHMTDDAEGGESGEDRMAIAGRRLAEAKKSGALPPGVEVDPANPYQIARFYEGRFREDARALGLKLAHDAEQDPSLMPRATENIPGMIEAVTRLLDRGCAYVVGEPGRRVVYFDVQSFPPYGRLSGNTLANLREGEGGRVSAQNQAGKKHPADFLLWKEDATHIMKWESPWGWGYPGWHIECTAMSLARLAAMPAPGAFIQDDPAYPGSLIDLHSGGEDNIFPHHECEIAQSCCAYAPSTLSGSFARLWFHPRFLLVEGAKMSKSKGNFFTARDLFAKGVEPAALRLELIKTHYRSNANFTMQGLADSQRMIDRWFFELVTLDEAIERPPHPQPGMNWAERAAVELDAGVKDFLAAMHEDLNLSGAVAAFNSALTLARQVSNANTTREDGKNYREAALHVVKKYRAAALDRDTSKVHGEMAKLIAAFDVLGLFDCARGEAPRETEIGLFAPGVAPDARVEDLLRRRRDARAAKDFKASDAIRDELAALGYAIKDMPGGRVEVRRA